MESLLVFADSWLKTEPKELNEYVALLVFISVFAAVMSTFGFVQMGNNPGDAMFTRTLTAIEHGWLGAAWKLVVFEAGEEGIYRMVCLAGVESLFHNDLMMLVCALIISLWFGFMPPHNRLPVRMRIGIGLGGFVLALIYLKCGGWGMANPIKGFIFSTIAHMSAGALIAGAFARHRLSRLAPRSSIE